MKTSENSEFNGILPGTCYSSKLFKIYLRNTIESLYIVISVQCIDLSFQVKYLTFLYYIEGKCLIDCY